MNESDPNWPRFWADVPDSDRPAIREILAELLGRGTLLGTEGSGRDLYLTARDHYQSHISDYLAPLGLDLIVDEDFCLLQARPRPEACLLLGQFTKDETLIILVLWRAWDDHRTTQASQTVVITVDDLWQRFRATFENIEPPGETHLDQLLARMKRHRLIRTHRTDPTAPVAETLIEILPSLARTIPFDSIESWLARTALYEPSAAAPASPQPPSQPQQP